MQHGLLSVYSIYPHRPQLWSSIHYALAPESNMHYHLWPGGLPVKGCSIFQMLCRLDDWLTLDHLVIKGLSLEGHIQANWLGWNSGILAHDVGTRCSINALDLTKMLFDQISTSSTILGVPGELVIMSPYYSGLPQFPVRNNAPWGFWGWLNWGGILHHHSNIDVWVWSMHLQ